MCMILVGRITKELHKEVLSQNRDGFSMFTEEQGLVKAPTVKQVEEAIKGAQFGIWHYRIGTSGRKDKFNIHPFQICEGRYLLYHNGVLGAGLGQMSDTHALAETLYDVGIETVRTVLRALSSNNRFLVASAKDPTRFELFGDWCAEAGVLMSHKMYRTSAYYVPSYSNKAYEEKEKFLLGGDLE